MKREQKVKNNPKKFECLQTDRSNLSFNRSIEKPTSFSSLRIEIKSNTILFEHPIIDKKENKTKPLMMDHKNDLV